jgi:hypothetical protein
MLIGVLRKDAKGLIVALPLSLAIRSQSTMGSATSRPVFSEGPCNSNFNHPAVGARRGASSSGPGSPSMAFQNQSYPRKAAVPARVRLHRQSRIGSHKLHSKSSRQIGRSTSLLLGTSVLGSFRKLHVDSSRSCLAYQSIQEMWA